MAEQSKGSEKSLEMRVAELEDKLSKIHITEDEMKAYHKVSSLLGTAGTQPAAPPTAIPQLCQIARYCTVARYCTIVRYCTIISNCAECINECGGGLPGAGGGGFGSLGG